MWGGMYHKVLQLFLLVYDPLSSLAYPTITHTQFAYNLWLLGNMVDKYTMYMTELTSRIWSSTWYYSWLLTIS